MSTLLTSIGQVNSISYQDLVGLLAGITRSIGENTAAFKNRIELAAISQKSHTYEGTVENVNTRLGLSIYPCISFTSSAITDISYEFGAVALSNATATYQVPVLNTTPDGFWNWLMLSDVVAGINQLGIGTASLLSPDGPSLQLARQKNSGWVINESVTGQVYPLSKSNLYVQGSEVFSVTNLAYQIVNGVLILDQPPVGLSISYMFKQMPYSLVASQGVVIALTDPAIQNYVIYNNDLIYQVKEVVQTLMNADGSYWGS